MKKVAILLALPLIILGCSQQKANTISIPDYEVATVIPTDMKINSSYPATIKGMVDVEIRPMVSGFITNLNVDEGAEVKKGQSLFSIDPTQYIAAVNTAKAGVLTAKAAVSTQELVVKNKRVLLKKGVISKYDLEMAENTLEQTKAKLAQANAQLVNAETNLKYTKVESPVSGVIGNYGIDLGSLVNPSSPQPLTNVTNINNVYAYFSMSERDLLELSEKEGTKKNIMDNMPEVQLELINGKVYSEKGRIDAISGVIDQTTGSVNMRAFFPNPKHILRSGASTNILIPTIMKNVFKVPQTATMDIQNKRFVFVVDGDNRVKSVEVTTASVDDGNFFWITSGLKSGDRIVMEGLQTLKNNMEINPITKEEKEKIFQQNLKDQAEGNFNTAFK